MKIKNWLMIIGMAVVALTFVSCSKEGGNNGKIVGEWLPSYEKFFIDGEEITLEEGQSLFIYKNNNNNINEYNDKYTMSSDFGLVSITFQNGGNMEFCGFPATYRVKGNTVVCTLMGEETILSIEGDFLVENEEATIMGYVISGGFWPDDDTIEKKLDGVSRKFKASTYYSKVN